MGNLKQWIPLIATVLSGILAALTPMITEWVKVHPDTATLIGVIIAAASHFFQPPDTTPTTKA